MIHMEIIWIIFVYTDLIENSRTVYKSNVYTLIFIINIYKAVRISVIHQSWNSSPPVLRRVKL